MGLGEANELAERFDVWETPVVHYALCLLYTSDAADE